MRSLGVDTSMVSVTQLLSLLLQRIGFSLVTKPESLRLTPTLTYSVRHTSRSGMKNCESSYAWAVPIRHEISSRLRTMSPSRRVVTLRTAVP